ncbi:hypothetical protein (nucleomorph) [Guillardia theta]|uniref:Uncharacterized protein n=1 Tax=Guillardia theta TaxID=55529 RepID=Q98S28_GUITH|nr:hypothetical protein GTHECHR3108 [Guillardia theta]AAK39752.1 hypothetical protein [Guillardia theta]|mmetsp:Transcript_20553/g.68915  ORF Transcript_20553/g.68915 Transcript_20553/m.68915 type:complete len:204 (-) Transcript_20553:895-1506(-)
MIDELLKSHDFTFHIIKTHQKPSVNNIGSILYEPFFFFKKKENGIIRNIRDIIGYEVFNSNKQIFSKNYDYRDMCIRRGKIVIHYKIIAFFYNIQFLNILTNQNFIFKNIVNSYEYLLSIFKNENLKNLHNLFIRKYLKFEFHKSTKRQKVLITKMVKNKVSCLKIIKKIEFKEYFFVTDNNKNEDISLNENLSVFIFKKFEN